jgi:nitrogen-specific signal transduction histidine kinase
LTTNYERLQQRQKGLEHRVNEKISNDIYNIQQILDILTRQSLKTERDYDNSLPYTNKGEEYRQSHMDIVNIDAQNTSTTNYKTKTDWYTSLLMYNSY